MKFSVFTGMEYQISSASTLILSISALRTSHQTVLSEDLTISPYIKAEELVSVNKDNRLIRFEASAPGTVAVSYKALVDNCCQPVDFSSRPETPVARLAPDILTFLYPSRYCQSDKLYGLANQLFGHIPNPFAQVLAVTDWIYNNVEYLSGTTNAQTSAFDTINQKKGVCRDFAHLGIALCRALTIPARYFTGYAYKLQPADFHACFEVYLDGQWILFDATKLVPVNGLVKIATGRDAADTAIANLFGGLNFTAMSVSCELADEGFEPVYYDSKKLTGLSYQ